MSNLQDIINYIMSNGIAVVIIGYFIYKDWTVSTKMQDTLTSIQNLLIELKNTNFKEE